MNSIQSVLILGALPEHLNQALAKLSEQGAAVRHVDGAYRLVASFATEPSDVTIIDLADLRQHDLEIIKVLRDINPHVGMVVLMDRDQHDLAANALCGGADLYLLKPITGPEFLAAVERASVRQRMAQTTDTPVVRPEALYDLARGVAHEINNPLTTISGWLQVLMNDHAQDEGLVNVLNSMKEEVDRIAEVVRQLLIFAQHGPPRRTAINLQEILDELGRFYSAKCHAKGAAFTAEIAPDLPVVPGDQRQIRQAFDTILAESTEAINGNGRIEVTCKPKDGGVEVVVTDNGPVIGPNTLERIFDPFNDGRAGNGKGMGLCLSMGILTSHGGALRASSSDVEGTRFIAWLPGQREQVDTA